MPLYRSTRPYSSGSGAPAGTGAEGEQYYDFTNDRLYESDGAGWVVMSEPEQSWTPTCSGLTVGDGVWDAAHRRGDGWYDFRARFTLGSSSAITGNIVLTLPYELAHPVQRGQFNIGFRDADGSSYQGYSANQSNTTQVHLAVLNASATYGIAAGGSSTVPITWTTSDEIDIVGRAQMLTRYT